MMAEGTVLVVDDDEDIVTLLDMVLQAQGYEVLTAVGGAAIEVARERHPDVILLDLMMPDMDGVEVSRRLRDDPITAGIAIIAMSAMHCLRGASTAMAVNDRLPKPFHVADLCAAVARWMPAARHAVSAA